MTHTILARRIPDGRTLDVILKIHSSCIMIKDCKVNQSWPHGVILSNDSSQVIIRRNVHFPLGDIAKSSIVVEHKDLA